MKKILFLANKQLPDNDYRIQYALSTNDYDVVIGMPGKTPILPRGKYVFFGFDEGISYKDIYYFLILFRYLINNRDLNLIHYFSTKLILFGPIIAYFLKIPCIITCTGFGRTFNCNGIFGILMRFIYLILIKNSIKKSNKVLFQNYGDMAFLTKQFPKFSKKFKYVGSGMIINYEFKEKDYFDKSLNVLLVSRLLPTKGIDIFLEISKVFKDSIFSFTLVGPHSSQFIDLKEKVLYYHNQRYIKYMGELFGDDLYEQFDNAHIFLFPSYYGEGLPRVLLEAGFARLCPIVYNINANLDLVDKSSGEIVEINDINGMIESLKILQENKDIIKEKAKKFHQHIKLNYSFDSYKFRLDSILPIIGNDNEM